MDLAALLRLPPHGLELFLLLLTRFSGIFLLAPIFGNAVVPARFRVGLAVLMAALIYPSAMNWPVPTMEGPLDVTFAMASELAIGVTLGFVANCAFFGIQMAGHMIALQMGLGMSMMFDPNTRTQTTELAVLFVLLATVTFLAMDGHHWLLLGVWKSFQAVPLGGFGLSGGIMEHVLLATTGIFDVALTLMLPVLGVLMLAELALAIMSRIMPQMNVFVAGFPVKIMLGLATLAATLPLLGGYMRIVFDRLSPALTGFFR
ncbi:Flagellar biosynthetic protein FliR [compost metagenome]